MVTGIRKLVHCNRKFFAEPFSKEFNNVYVFSVEQRQSAFCYLGPKDQMHGFLGGYGSFALSLSLADSPAMLIAGFKICKEGELTTACHVGVQCRGSAKKCVPESC